MRLFFAIILSDPVREHLRGLQALLKPIAPASYVKPENLHLTLKFLGEVPEARVKSLCEAAARIAPVGAFSLAADRIVCFPEKGRIRIVGAGMDTPAQLRALVEGLDDVGAHFGFHREKRAYTAHVTLARCRSPLQSTLRDRLSHTAQEHLPGPTMHISQFVLMQSLLKREGAEYTPVAHLDI